MLPAAYALLSRIAEDALRERGFVPHPSAEAIAEAAGARGPGAGADGLPDLRGLAWTSIDNPESQDLDQIEVAEPAGDGGTRLYVAIADVSWFVRPGSAIDAFAAGNTTSVYTGVTTFPMLPERLSFDLSSLLAERMRAAIVIETLIRADGSIAEGKVYPALVENQGKLDYPSVSAWLDGAGPEPAVLAAAPELAEQVRRHDRLAKTLAEARRREGSLDVDTGEVRAAVDAAGQVVGLRPHHQDRAGSIVEELMIASNRAVAQALDDAGMPSLRRVVKAPERWARIVSYAGERGHTLPAAPSSLALAGFVDAMRRTRPEEFGEISLALVKLMGRGEYAAHAPGQPDTGHFGLGILHYTHATAPNRRYADLVTQRLVKALQQGRAAPYTVDELAAIAERCSRMEAEAERVQRRIHKSIAASLLEPRVGERFAAIVTGASDKGTFARLLDPVAEGKVTRNAQGLRVGDKVQVRLIDVSVEKGFIDLEARR